MMLVIMLRFTILQGHWLLPKRHNDRLPTHPQMQQLAADMYFDQI